MNNQLLIKLADNVPRMVTKYRRENIILFIVVCNLWFLITQASWGPSCMFAVRKILIRYHSIILSFRCILCSKPSQTKNTEHLTKAAEPIAH